MMIATIAMAGGTIAVSRHVLRKSHRRPRAKSWIDYCIDDDTEFLLTDEKKASSFALYPKINAFHQTLQVDKFVPISRQLQDPLFQTDLSPWAEKKITLGAQLDKAKIATHQPAKQDAQQTEDSLSDNLHRLWRYIIKYWRPYWGVAVVSGASLMVFGLYETTFAYALKVIADGATSANGLAAVFPVVQKLLIAFPVVALVTIVGERVNARLGSRIINDIQYDIFEHLQKLSLDFYKKTKLGDILARFSSDMLYVRMGMATILLPSIVDLLTLSVNIAFMFWLSWQMALISMLSLPLMVYVLREFSPRVSEANFALKNQEALMMNAVQEGVRAQPVIKSFSTQPFIQDAFLTELNKLESKTTEALFSRAMFESSSVISLFLAQLVSMSVGLLLLGGGYLSIGTLLSYMVVQTAASQDLRQLIRNRLHLLITAAVGLRRVDLLLQNQIEIVDAPDAIELAPFCQTIRFEDVSFGYTEQSYQLKQINLTIEPGQFVAFVGPSGAGKSTIFNLLLRFYDVSTGCITFDGVDIRSATQASLRQQLGIVLQETFIFNTSILNNIRIAKPTATETEVIQAAQAAELHDFIMSLPDGYATNAGEAGGRLSGGQKQRIAIARAMLCNPAILIFDEATNGLDANTAGAINATIQVIAQTRTVITITHALSAVVNADKIYVLEQGHVVEQGTHAALLLQDGLYTQLWQTQTNGSPDTTDGLRETVAN